MSPKSKIQNHDPSIPEQASNVLVIPKSFYCKASAFSFELLLNFKLTDWGQVGMPGAGPIPRGLESAGLLVTGSSVFVVSTERTPFGS